MQSVHRVALGDVYRFFFGLGSKEYATIATALDGAHKFALLEYKAEVSVGGLYQAALNEQVTDNVGTKHLLRVGGEVQLLPDATVCKGTVAMVLEEVDEGIEHHAFAHALGFRGR